MAAACIHGYPPDECIICKTLGQGTSNPANPAVATRRRARAAADSPAPPPAKAADRSPRGESGGGGHTAAHVALLLAVLVGAALSVWFVTGVLLHVFHLVELIVVAGVAGTLGYRLGHRSRRS